MKHTTFCRPLTAGFLLVILALSGCFPGATAYDNGVYRGVFIDKDVIQMNVEFTLIDGVITEAEFRHLQHEEFALETEVEPYKSVIAQYQEALDYLVGKELSENLADLYLPHTIITREVDGYTAATLRTNKIISAIRDGLNRGVYTPVHTL